MSVDRRLLLDAMQAKLPYIGVHRSAPSSYRGPLVTRCSCTDPDTDSIVSYPMPAALSAAFTPMHEALSAGIQHKSVHCTRPLIHETLQTLLWYAFAVGMAMSM